MNRMGGGPYSGGDPMLDLAEMLAQSDGGGLMGGGGMMPGLGGGRMMPGMGGQMPGIGPGSMMPGTGQSDFRRRSRDPRAGTMMPGAVLGRGFPGIPRGQSGMPLRSRYDSLIPERSQFRPGRGVPDFSTTIQEEFNTFSGRPRRGLGVPRDIFADNGYDSFSGRPGYGSRGRAWGRQGANRMARRFR